MGNRSRYIARAAAVAGVGMGWVALRARFRARLRRALEEALPVTLPPPGSSPGPTDDEAHAPGHRHLGPEEQLPGDRPHRRVRQRAWTKQYHGLRHPGRGG